MSNNVLWFFFVCLFVCLCFCCCCLTGFSLGAEAVVLGELIIYFDKYYDVSSAISQVGLSFGIIAIPPLTQFCLDLYGWQGTALLLAGANLHLVMCGALLRPFSLRGENEIDMDEEADNISEDDIVPKQNI